MKTSTFTKTRLFYALLPVLLAMTLSAQGQSPCNGNFTTYFDTLTGNVTYVQVLGHKIDSLTYNWKLDGSTVSSSFYWNHQFFTPGHHQVCLTVSNPKDSNCHSTHCDSIFIPYNQDSQCFARFFDSIVGPGTHNFLDMSGGFGIDAYYWNFGDGTSDTTTYGFANKKYNIPGTYTVCLTIFRLKDSCTSTTCQTITFTNGIDKLHPAITYIKAYPVPFGSELNLDLTTSKTEPADLLLSDMTGRTVWQQKVSLLKGENHVVVHLPELPAGVYLMQLSTPDGTVRQQLLR